MLNGKSPKALGTLELDYLKKENNKNSFINKKGPSI